MEVVIHHPVEAVLLTDIINIEVQVETMIRNVKEIMNITERPTIERDNMEKIRNFVIIQEIEEINLLKKISIIISKNF